MGKVCLTCMHDPSAKENFHSRVRSLLKACPKSCHSSDEESLEHNFDGFIHSCTILTLMTRCDFPTTAKRDIAFSAFKVPISSKFLFSHLILYSMQ